MKKKTIIISLIIIITITIIIILISNFSINDLYFAQYNENGVSHFLVVTIDKNQQKKNPKIFNQI